MARFTYVMSDIHGQFDALMRMLEQIGFAIGGAPFENYQKAWEYLNSDEEVIEELKQQSYAYNKIGLFYYDDNNIVPGTYFCYKVLDI